MILKSISIVNYRNIRQADLELSPFVNCFLGNNGEGKTNILDSIYYLSFCKSFANITDSQNILFGEDFFVIQGLYHNDNERNEEIYSAIKRVGNRTQKTFKRNQKEYDRLSQHIGLIPLVIASPDDISLVYDGSEERRKFIDLIVSQTNSLYIEALINYNKALQQRNTLLKEKQRERDHEVISIYEEQMEYYGRTVYEWRKQIIEKLHPYFKEFHQWICMKKEEVSLEYISSLEKEESLAAQLAQNRERDYILGYTTRGIHRDDINILMNGYPLRRVASQGQIKSYLVALKLAKAKLLITLQGQKPIILLDDIFDKLDETRVKQIINLVSDGSLGQIFITDTNRQHIDTIISSLTCEYHNYHVQQGVISKA